MAASGPRFCPRCGTGRIGEMGFCPNCGLDLRQLPRDEESPGAPPQGPIVVPASASGRSEPLRERSAWGPLLFPGLLVLLLLAFVAASWLAGLGPFARPGDGPGPFAGAASQTPQPSLSLPPGFTAPPVGLTILSPADGSAVGSKEVTVIGTAPPGLRITQDVSFGLDRHATADGTGHWAIGAELSEGENQLHFRIGDDRSTTQTIRVIYLAPSP